jgi:hypothetical protein
MSTVRMPALPSGFSSAPRQRGAVLIVGLIMLAVMSLLVISMIRTSILELRIGGANQVALETFANAEVAMVGVVTANSGRWAPRFTTLPVGNPGRPDLTPPVLVNGTATVTIQQIACGFVADGSSVCSAGRPNCVPKASFNVAAAAQSVLGGVQRVSQGVEVSIAPNACN